MNFLDDNRHYQTYDSDNIYDSLTKFGRQFESGWHTAEFANIDFDPEKIKNIIFAGMGGSNLAGEIVKSLGPFILNVPFEICANYRLPSYAGKNSLVVLSSYSGNTEEVLSCAQDAAMRDCKTVYITTGGKLKDIANGKDLSIVELDGKLNPSQAPRAGIFLSLGAVISLLLRLNPVAKKYFNQKDITQTMERVQDLVNIQKETSNNPAKTLAVKHKGLGVVFLSANHLSGVGKVLNNYLNESSKTYASVFTFPDLNHHFLDGLTFPTSLKDDINFIILNSGLFPEVIQKRIQITKDILIKQKYRITVLKPESSDPVLQVFESLAFLIMFSYYLSIVNKVDPTTNPWVDHLKKELKT